MKRRPLISVIVPFYNAQNNIEKCVYSILEAGKRVPLEIICLNDGSTDKSKNIVFKIACKHRNVRVISHKNNKGLFQARITALSHIKGRYIGFVDSDDYIKEDYFEQLYHNLINNNADIAVGRIVNVTKDNVHYIQTRCKDFPYGKKKPEESYYDMFWKQEGKCYPWHVVWNKLYKRELWESSMEELKKIYTDITMMEDFVFSSIILSKANQIVKASQAYYYYVQSDFAATSHTADFKKWKKNIIHMSEAFWRITIFLAEDSDKNKYINNLKEWKKRYSRYWTRNIRNTEFSDDEKIFLLELLKNGLGEERLQLANEEDEYYYSEAEFSEVVP